MLVLDANILIRAILGHRVRELIESYAPKGIRFFTPGVAFEDARKYLHYFSKKRNKPQADISAALEYLRSDRRRHPIGASWRLTPHPNSTYLRFDRWPRRRRR